MFTEIQTTALLERQHNPCLRGSRGATSEGPFLPRAARRWGQSLCTGGVCNLVEKMEPEVRGDATMAPSPWNILYKCLWNKHSMKGAKSMNSERRTQNTVGQSVQGNLRETGPGGVFWRRSRILRVTWSVLWLGVFFLLLSQPILIHSSEPC